MKVIALSLCYLFLGIYAFSNEGIVITNTDSISGQIKVDLEQNRITVREGNSYSYLYARDIKKVTIKKEEKDQVYITAPFGFNSEWFLFEALSDGKLPLLYREGIKLSKYDEEEFPPIFMKIDESVYSLDSKKQVLEAMNDRSGDVKNYLKSNKTNFSDKEDLTKLFDFYNSLD
jgi:hypothetical protein